MRIPLLLTLLALATACHRTPTAASASAADSAKSAAYVIRFERTPCMGKCPAFSAEIRPDGSFTYQGGPNAPQEGAAQGKMSKDAVANALSQAREMSFAKLPADEYGKGMTDAPSAILTVVERGQAHTVTCVGGECPAQLKELHAFLDEQIRRGLVLVNGRAPMTAPGTEK